MIDSLTGVRAVALVFVVAFHFQTDLFRLLPATDLLRPVIGLAPLGPDLFFMLSGFVLCYRYASEFGTTIRAAQLREYLVMRVARIYPVHLVTLHAMVALVVGAQLAGLTLNSGDVTRFDLSSYLQNLVLVHAWFGQNMSWNYPAWSVSAEWFAYALFPLVALAVFRLRRAWPAWVLALALVLGYWAVERQLAPVPGEVNLEGALLRVSADFVAGCLVYRASVLTPVVGRWWAAVPPVAALVLLTGAYVLPLDLDLMLPVMLLVLFSLARRGGLVGRLFATRGFVAVGMASYSVYMVHALVLAGSSRATALLVDTPLVVRGAYVVVVLAAVGVAGALLYSRVEQPCRRAIARRLVRRPALAHPAVDGAPRPQVEVPEPRTPSAPSPQTPGAATDEVPTTDPQVSHQETPSTPTRRSPDPASPVPAEEDR